MANFVDSSVPEVGSSSGAERMTCSGARRNCEERAAAREVNTLARRTAEPGRQSRHPHPGEEDRSARETEPPPARCTPWGGGEPDATGKRELPDMRHPGNEDHSSQGERAATCEKLLLSSFQLQPGCRACY